jgi:hypothetical protein
VVVVVFECDDCFLGKCCGAAAGIWLVTGQGPDCAGGIDLSGFGGHGGGGGVDPEAFELVLDGVISPVAASEEFGEGAIGGITGVGLLEVPAVEVELVDHGAGGCVGVVGAEVEGDGGAEGALEGFEEGVLFGWLGHGDKIGFGSGIGHDLVFLRCVIETAEYTFGQIGRCGVVVANRGGFRDTGEQGADVCVCMFL